MAKRNLTESELRQQLEAYKLELSEEKYQKVLREGDHVCGLEALHAWQSENKNELTRIVFLRDEIRTIEWKLMSPEEREREKAHIKNVMDRWQSEAEVRLGPENK